MLNVVVKTIAQIAVGVAVGNAASDAMDKYVVEPIKKVVKAKKEKKDA